VDLVDYVRHEGMLTFTERPLNDVDGVILAQLSYMDFDYLYSRAIHSVADFTNDAVMAGCVRDTWNPDGNYRLLLALARSVRFGSLSWSLYKNHLDLGKEQQFTAVTFALGGNAYYISYRGTSAALVDWKEDLNMTFLEAIPSQISALEYFKAATHLFGTHDTAYYLGGHSKGGNLAIYAAVNAPDDLQKTLRGVYSVDGPGIKQPIDPAIVPRVHKLIPESSIVGLLLEPDKHYTVVKSNGRGIDQHDPFTWSVEGEGFTTLEAVSSFSRFTEKSVARWLESVDDETKQEFLSSLFAVFDAAQFSQLPDMTDDISATMRTLRRSVRGKSVSERKKWRSVTDAFVGSVVAEARASLSARGGALLSDIGGVVNSSVETVKSVSASVSAAMPLPSMKLASIKLPSVNVPSANVPSANVSSVKSPAQEVFEFDAQIRASKVGKGGAYVIFPYDIRELFGKGRLKVAATFDGVDYDGSIVNMGVKGPEGEICYILGVRKDIRAKIGKDIGQNVHVRVVPRAQ
jgi:hypothetical protein